MNNPSKAYHDLLRENEVLKQRIIELEQSEADRTLADERLAFSRQQLLLLIESGPDFFFLKDTDLRYQLINEANARFFGRDKDDILGKTDMELMPGEAGAACGESDRQAIREKKIVVTVEPVGDRYYETYKFPVLADGIPVGLGGIIRDITERMLAEEKLKKSKALLESVFNSTQDLILVVDRDLRILMSNWKSPLFAGQTGFPTNAHCYEAFVRRDTPCETCHALAVFNTGKPSVVEYYNSHTKLVKEVNAYPLFDDDKRVAMVVEHVRDITESKRAEEALRESEERLRLFIRYAPASLAMFDRKMRYLSCSHRWLKDYNLGERDLTGLSHYEIFPGIPDSWKVARRRGLAGEVTKVEEERFERPDGSVQWLRWEVRPWHDHTGDIAGILIFTENITERKNAEQELRASEEKYRRLFDNAVLGFFRCTPGGKLLAFNPAFARMFGYSSPDETAGVPELFSDFYADPSRRLSITKMLEKTGEPIQVENLFKRVDQSTFVGNLHVRMARDVGGETVHEGFIEDISDRKRAEDALRESEEQFRAIFEMASIGVAQADPQTGRWLRVNRKMCEITGYSSNEMLAMRVQEITHPEDRARDWEGFRGVVTGNSPSYRIEKRYIRKDGRVIWVNVNMTVIRDLIGRPLRTVATIEDITDRRHAEEQIRGSLHEKEILLREIYHRVKNNLQVMSSLLNMQSRYINDPEDAGYFKASMNRIRSMALVHDKLYRSESLANIYFPEYVNDLVRGLIAAYSPDKGIGLDIDIDPVSFDVDTAIPLGLIINELVSNSLKHGFPETADGIIAIRLHDGDGRMTLTVSDDGIGFPGELDFTDTPSLGMQLVVTLVEQIEGAMELGKDSGTEFRITFKAET